MEQISLYHQLKDAISHVENSTMRQGLESLFPLTQAYYWDLLQRQAMIQKKVPGCLKNYLTSDSNAYKKRNRSGNYNENHLTVEEILHIKVIHLLCQYGGSSVTKILKLDIPKCRTELARLWDIYFYKKDIRKRKSPQQEAHFQQALSDTIERWGQCYSDPRMDRINKNLDKIKIAMAAIEDVANIPEPTVEESVEEIFNRQWLQMLIESLNAGNVVNAFFRAAQARRALYSGETSSYMPVENKNKQNIFNARKCEENFLALENNLYSYLDIYQEYEGTLEKIRSFGIDTEEMLSNKDKQAENQKCSDV